jgi:hypothetical protein
VIFVAHLFRIHSALFRITLARLEKWPWWQSKGCMFDGTCRKRWCGPWRRNYQMDTTSSELNRAGSLRAAYFTKAQLAAELDRTVRTIDRWLAIGEGPPVTLLGREQLFKKNSVAAWLASRERQVVG